MGFPARPEHSFRGALNALVIPKNNLSLALPLSLQIFQSEDVELPRPKVADFLETIDPRICARFIEYLIEEKGEDSVGFHNRLAELYLKMATPGRSVLPEGIHSRPHEDLAFAYFIEASRSEAYATLLTFIDTTVTYQTDRLFGLLPSEGCHPQ
jgi:hypothetical protein